MMRRAALFFAAALAVQAEENTSEWRAQAAALVAQAKYAEAEPLLVRVLEAREKEADPDDPRVTPAIEELAALYRAQGRAGDAEKMYLRALQIKEKASGAQSLAVIPDLKRLAGLYAGAGRASDAEKQHLRIV